jgi:uncharacterized protein (DUF433 family)
MIVEPITHIQRDERGVAWIADTNTKVIEVAMDQVAYGWDAKEIHAAHPHLSLAQIHAALSFYHDHKGGDRRADAAANGTAPATADRGCRPIDTRRVTGTARAEVSVALYMDVRSDWFCKSGPVSAPQLRIG